MLTKQVMKVTPNAIYMWSAGWKSVLVGEQLLHENSMPLILIVSCWLSLICFFFYKKLTVLKNVLLMFVPFDLQQNEQ